MNQDAYNQLEALIHLFQEHNLDELLVEEDSLRVHLRKDRAVSGPAPPPPVQAAPKPLPQKLQRSTRTVAVRSPLIGIFYGSPSPDAPWFVEIGDMVEEGQTVCIVEAMKVFNEIKAEWSGRVIAIPAQSGKLVQAGEPLVVLEFPRDGREGA